MLIIPAIDLKGGRCVRLTEGRQGTEKVYDLDPVAVAREYRLAGASLIHVVDLDGAFGAESENRQLIRQIAEEAGIPIEVGGGVRSIGDVESLIGDGASYVILGTMAVEDEGALTEAVNSFGDSIVVGIDAREGRVAVRGWNDETSVDALRLARRVADIG